MAAVTSQGKQSRSPPSDAVLLLENKIFSRSGSGAGSVLNGFSPVGWSWSDLSSQLGSELGSTETESEEDDEEFMAELTRQMADYILPEDDDESAVIECGAKKFKLHKENNTRSVRNQVNKCKQGMVKGVGLAHRPEQKKPNGAQNRAAGVLGALPEVWPMLQPPQKNYGSDMKAVFLVGPTSKARNSGTGVFLPRAASTSPDVDKKIGSSTVLIPIRVLNALHLHFQNVNSRYHSNGSASLKSYPPHYDVTPTQEQQHSQTQSHSSNKISEIGLPQEWTY